MIVQDFIPGDDSNMRVLNAYVDENHEVRVMCLRSSFTRRSYPWRCWELRCDHSR